MITRCRLSFLMAAALTLLAGMVRADFHVDPVSGNDTNDGLSHDTAFKSGNKAWNTSLAANAAQSPFTTPSVIHFWPAASVTNSTTTGTLPTLTNEVIFVGENAAAVPLNAGSYFNIGYNTAGPAKLTISNIDLSLGKPGTDRSYQIGMVDQASCSAATGRVVQVGGSFSVYSTGHEFIVGRATTGSPDVLGELDLSGVTGSVSMNLQYVRVGECANNASVYGSCNWRSRGTGVFNAYSLHIVDGGSAGARGTGLVTVGSNWTFQVGSPSWPGRYLYIARACGCATGSLTLAGGGTSSFCAYLTSDLDVGYNCTTNGYGILDLSAMRGPVMLRGATMRVGRTGGTVYGVVDAGMSTNVTYSFSTLYVGSDALQSAYGRLTLGQGTGTVGSATLGRNAVVTGSNFGLLELHGMQLAVTGSLTIDKSGAVSNFVNGASSGLNVTNALATALKFNNSPTVASGAGINIVFQAMPPRTRPVSNASSATDILWGLKWAGNHVSDVNTLIADGRMAYDTSALDAVAAAATGVFYDAATDTTYVGFYTRERGSHGTMIRIM